MPRQCGLTHSVPFRLPLFEFDRNEAPGRGSATGRQAIAFSIASSALRLSTSR